MSLIPNLDHKFKEPDYLLPTVPHHVGHYNNLYLFCKNLFAIIRFSVCLGWCPMHVTYINSKQKIVTRQASEPTQQNVVSQGCSFGTCEIGMQGIPKRILYWTSILLDVRLHTSKFEIASSPSLFSTSLLMIFLFLIEKRVKLRERCRGRVNERIQVP
jgi:hypothetical protein